MKNFKKILSLILVAVMSLSLLSGCQKKEQKNATMFSAMEEAAEFENYSYSVDVDLKLNIEEVDFNKASVSLYGEVAGKDMSMSVKVKTPMFTVDAKDVLTVKDGTFYVNLEDVINTVDAFYPIEDELVELEDQLGVKLRGLAIPVGKDFLNAVANNEDSTKLSIKILETAFEKIDIDTKKGEYTVSITNNKDLAKLLNGVVKAIKENKAEIVDISVKSMEGQLNAATELVYTYLDLVVDTLYKYFGDEMPVEASEIKSQFKAGFEAAMEEVDLDNLKDEIKDAVDEAVEELEEIDLDEIEELEDADFNFTMTSSLSGKNGAREYATETVLKVEDKSTTESVEIKITSKLSEHKDGAVKAPKNCTSVEDILEAVCKLATEAGVSIEDVLSFVDLDDILGDFGGYDPGVVLPTEPYVEPTTSSRDYADGEVVVTNYANDNITIEFDKDLIEVDYDFSNLDYGRVCLQTLDGREWMFLTYTDDTDVVEFVNDQMKYTAEAGYDITVVAQPVYVGKLAGYAFTYDEGASVKFFVPVKGGILYADLDYVDFTYGDLDIDSFLEAALVNVTGASTDIDTSVEFDFIETEGIDVSDIIELGTGDGYVEFVADSDKWVVNTTASNIENGTLVLNGYDGTIVTALYVPGVTVEDLYDTLVTTYSSNTDLSNVVVSDIETYEGYYAFYDCFSVNAVSAGVDVVGYTYFVEFEDGIVTVIIEEGTIVKSLEDGIDLCDEFFPYY